MSILEESLRSLSLDYLNLLINDQAFNDVTFSVEGHLVHRDLLLSNLKSFISSQFKRTETSHHFIETKLVNVKKKKIPKATSSTINEHLSIDVVAKIEELRLQSFVARRSMMPHHHHHHHNHDLRAAADLEDQKIRRMKLALDSSDVELVKLMVMDEGLNLDMELALHYICSRKLGGEVVKALLELGAGDMNYPAGPARKYPASHCFRNGVSRHGAVPGLTHIEPNKLILCLELVQSDALVLSREEGNNNANNPNSSNSTVIYPPISDDHHSSGSNIGNLNLDSRLVYLNLEVTHQMGSRNMEGHDHHNRVQSGCDPSTMYHHSHDY
ncbi:hypothetical protein DVH24_004892 [Malus domestica]|uniref:Regulatory protein NPR central domain-containing protein n=1 Tax=Malus domestica TaxID=3750 RepID=A0A498IB41_MALDO|nr:hypothetical protein DVH24_004892 [Malus domestica]